MSSVIIDGVRSPIGLKHGKMLGMRSDDIKYFKENYKTASNRLNLFGLFVEKSFNLMNVNSEYGMIIHRNLIRSNEYEKCRESYSKQL